MGTHNTDRKRGPSKVKLARMEAFRAGWSDRDAEARKQVARLRVKLRQERARWDEKCPKGHLVRHDECDLVGCLVTSVEPFSESIRPLMEAKTVAPGFTHEWGEKYRALDKQFAADKAVGWWWRVLAVRRWWMLTDEEIEARAIIGAIKKRGTL